LPSITVRPAVESDFAAIGRIQYACEEASQWPLGDYSNFSLLLASTAAGPAGFCAWRQLGDEEAELLNLAVDPSARRQGVAGAILEHLCEAATGEIFLEVAESNTAAIGLYRKFGWTAVSVRKGYYQNGCINAVVMKKGSW
jgi:ribosomal protein S18 acetylase RimI-like enzyme